MAVVGVGQPLADLHDDVDGLPDGEHPADPAPPLQQLLQIHPVDELHHDEVRLVGVADVEHLDDVGVLEVQRQPRLVQEHGDELLVLRQRGQNALDGDVLAESLDGFGDALKTSAIPPAAIRSVMR
jgi:hypothetical protein